MAATRIYQVVNKATGATHLVRATSRAQAIGHVSRNAFTVKVADQETLVAGLIGGVELEDAGAE